MHTLPHSMHCSVRHTDQWALQGSIEDSRNYRKFPRRGTDGARSRVPPLPYARKQLAHCTGCYAKCRSQHHHTRTSLSTLSLSDTCWQTERRRVRKTKLQGGLRRLGSWFQGYGRRTLRSCSLAEVWKTVVPDTHSRGALAAALPPVQRSWLRSCLFEHNMALPQGCGNCKLRAPILDHNPQITEASSTPGPLNSTEERVSKLGRPSSATMNKLTIFCNSILSLNVASRSHFKMLLLQGPKVTLCSSKIWFTVREKMLITISAIGHTSTVPPKTPLPISAIGHTSTVPPPKPPCRAIGHTSTVPPNCNWS